MQQKLDDILAIQNVIVQNQHDMYDKLKDIEFRLVSVESRIARPAQQMPSSSTAKAGLLHPQSGSQRMSMMPLWQSMRLKRSQELAETDETTVKETVDLEKRMTKRARGDDDEPEEGEVNMEESATKETEPGASSKADEEADEESEADYDDDSTESSSTANISYSQKSTPPLTMHRSSMPHSILQSLATSSLLSSLQPRLTDLSSLATDESTGTVYLDEPEIRRIFATSKSRGNFSALLVQKLYTKDERVVSNVMGTRGKRQLSPTRMAAVRRLSFSLYPVGDEREEDTVWKKECVKAIDSKNRKVRTHHSVKSECASAPPGGISSAPSSGPLSRANPRLLGTRPPFSMGLSPGHSTPGSSANAFAIAMAAAAAAAVASSNSENRSPKSEAKHQPDLHNS